MYTPTILQNTSAIDKANSCELLVYVFLSSSNIPPSFEPFPKEFYCIFHVSIHATLLIFPLMDVLATEAQYYSDFFFLAITASNFLILFKRNPISHWYNILNYFQFNSWRYFFMQKSLSTYYSLLIRNSLCRFLLFFKNVLTSLFAIHPSISCK